MGVSRAEGYFIVSTMVIYRVFSLKLPSSKGGQGTEWDDKVVLEGPPGWFLFVALAVLELTL